MNFHVPPMAIRTRACDPGACLTTGLNEHLDEAVLSSDAFEKASLRDEPSDEELSDFATPTALPSSPSALRFFLLGKSHTSFKTTSAMDGVASLSPPPARASSVASFGECTPPQLSGMRCTRCTRCSQSHKSQKIVFRSIERACARAHAHAHARTRAASNAAPQNILSWAFASPRRGILIKPASSLTSPPNVASETASLGR